jgi:hypothetical protein
VAYVDDINALSPIHYWRLNGNANDTGIGPTLNGGGTGVNFSGVALHPGNTASAEFDRGSDNILVASSTSLDNQVRTQFTCSMIVQPTLDTLPFPLVVSSGATSGIHMFLTSGMVPAITIGNSTASTLTVFANRPLIINEAANVVFRYDAGTVDIFIDGRNVANSTAAPVSVPAIAAGTDIGGSGSTSATVPITGNNTFTLYTLSGRMSDIATWNSLISDSVIFDTLFSGAAVSRTTQISLTNVPDVTEVRFFDLDNSLAEVAGIETITPATDEVTLDYSVVTELRTRLAILNVDERFNPFYADDVILPREGASFPVNLLLTEDRVYSGTFVTPIAPSILTNPVITGTPEVGQVLTLTDVGTYDGRPTPTTSQRWQRGGVDIPGETGTTYTLQLADDGSIVTCVVTATNTGGSVEATSNPVSLLSTGFVGIFQHTGGAVAGTAAAVFDYDTAVRNDGAAYSKTGSAFDLPAGRYLVNATVGYRGSGANGRGNLVLEARKNSTVIPGSRSSGYQRDTANDAQWCTSTFIVESTGSDQLDFRIFRDSDSSLAALSSSMSYLSIVSIEDSTDIGEYNVTSTTAFGAQTYATLALGTVQEVGTNIQRTGNDISLSNGKYLISGGVHFDGTTARTARFSRFLLDGQHVPGSSSYAYGRDGNNEFMSCNSFAIVEVTSGPLTLNFQARGPGPGGVTVDGGATVNAAASQITVVELNSGADFYFSEDATAAQSGSGNPTVVNFNRTVQRTSSALTSTSNTSVTANGDSTLFLAAGAMVRRTASSGTRLTREYRFLLDGSEIPSALHGGYNRGDQGDQDVYDSAHHPRGIAELTNGQVLTFQIDKTNDPGWNDGGGTPLTDSSEPIGFYALDLSTV